MDSYKWENPRAGTFPKLTYENLAVELGDPRLQCEDSSVFNSVAVMEQSAHLFLLQWQSTVRAKEFAEESFSLYF